MANRIVLGAVALVAVLAATPAAADRWWGGAALGVSLGGNVDYASVEPVIGYWVNEKVTVGGRAILRYRKDNRIEGASSQNDYGLAAFARYFPAKRFFVQGEYEWISYETVFSDRNDYGSLWGGGGYAQPVTKNSWFAVSAMYNFTWDEDEPSPYAEPWVLRAGIGFRF